MARNRAWRLKVDRLGVAAAALTAVAGLFFEHVTRMPAFFAKYLFPGAAVMTWLEFRDQILDRSDDPEELPSD
jgi:hypothetical protein